MPSKYTDLISFYTNFSSGINAKFVDLATQIDGLEKKLIKVVVPEEGGGGGLFYKMAAVNCANYMRDAVISGKAFAGVEGLSESTHSIKGGEITAKAGGGTPLYHKTRFGQIGMATGQMVNAIRPVKANKGWKVGIPQTAKIDGSYKKIGKITSIYQYAYILEHGRDQKAGTAYQPPRPWFGSAFIMWAKEKAPALYESTFLQEFTVGLMKSVSGVSSIGTSDTKEVQGLFTGSGMHKQTKFYRTRVPSGRYEIAGELSIVNKLGKTVKLFFDNQANFVDREGAKWRNLAQATKKWNLPDYK